jgi:activating signal cointegrator complex subunit 3
MVYTIIDRLNFLIEYIGRPQFDNQGIAVIMVHDVKKHFYKKFLYEPFPVESSLLSVLPDHLNAEIVAATITTKQEAMDYLTWTYFFRRLLVNPSYYELESLENTQLNKYLSQLVERCLAQLESSFCLTTGESGELTATTAGRIASFYYISHETIKMFEETLNDDVDIESLVNIVSMAKEFGEFPVRHNEDKLNAELSNDVPFKVNSYAFESPHTKVNLLMQAHYSQIQLPIVDYITDTKSVLDQCLRIMQAMLDCCADRGYLKACLHICNLIQMSCQGRWLSDSDLLTLPHIDTEHLSRFYNSRLRIDCLPKLIEASDRSDQKSLLEDLVGDLMDKNQIKDIYHVISILPLIEVTLSIFGEAIPFFKQNKDKDANNKLKIDTKNESTAYELYEDEEYVLNVDLRRLNRVNSKKREKEKAHAPKFPKPKEENWILILGTQAEASQELLCLKRVSYIKSQLSVHLLFRTSKIKENNNTEEQYMSLFLMSDAYLGLDQQFDLKLKLIKKA